jgi:hypothetical protein
MAMAKSPPWFHLQLPLLILVHPARPVRTDRQFIFEQFRVQSAREDKAGTACFDFDGC